MLQHRQKYVEEQLWNTLWGQSRIDRYACALHIKSNGVSVTVLAAAAAPRQHGGRTRPGMPSPDGRRPADPAAAPGLSVGRPFHFLSHGVLIAAIHLISRALSRPPGPCAVFMKIFWRRDCGRRRPALGADVARSEVANIERRRQSELEPRTGISNTEVLYLRELR